VEKIKKIFLGWSLFLILSIVAFYHFASKNYTSQEMLTVVISLTIFFLLCLVGMYWVIKNTLYEMLGVPVLFKNRYILEEEGVLAMSIEVKWLGSDPMYLVRMKSTENLIYEEPREFFMLVRRSELDEKIIPHISSGLNIKVFTKGGKLTTDH
jgi:hypothetical protein